MNLEHKKRVISAVVGLIGLLALYYFFGHYGVVVFAVAVSTAAYYEFLTFSGSAGAAKVWPLLCGFMLSLWLCFWLPGGLTAVYLAALAVLLRALWRAHCGGPEALAPELQSAQIRIFGLTYLIVFPSFVPKVHALPHGPALLLMLIGIIWLGDIGAYYGGKSFGRNKLSLNISPGKTREGALVALLVCAVWAWAYGAYMLGHIPSWKWIGIAVLTSVVAQAGDLIESMIKRVYSVKDSGNLIPGHGGVYDRFDSLILAVPFFYLLLRLAT